MMLYPKQPAKKKRMVHPPSIIRQEPGTCYLCIKLHNDYRCWTMREEHHVFDGPNRKISEENGFKVKLCIGHHRTSPEAVHTKKENMLLIQQDVQREYEKTHTRQQFMSLIGRNYLEDDNAE